MTPDQCVIDLCVVLCGKHPYSSESAGLKWRSVDWIGGGLTSSWISTDPEINPRLTYFRALNAFCSCVLRFRLALLISQ